MRLLNFPGFFGSPAVRIITFENPKATRIGNTMAWLDCELVHKFKLLAGEPTAPVSDQIDFCYSWTQFRYWLEIRKQVVQAFCLENIFCFLWRQNCCPANPVELLLNGSKKVGLAWLTNPCRALCFTPFPLLPIFVFEEFCKKVLDRVVIFGILGASRETSCVETL